MGVLLHLYARVNPLYTFYFWITNVFVSISFVHVPDSSKSCSYLWSFSYFSQYFLNSKKHLDIWTNILVHPVPEARN